MLARSPGAGFVRESQWLSETESGSVVRCNNQLSCLSLASTFKPA